MYVCMYVCMYTSSNRVLVRLGLGTLIGCWLQLDAKCIYVCMYECMESGHLPKAV